MYKVILVDDEDEVREGIKLKIDWRSCGFELVGDYDNGRDALEVLEPLQPDVIITDICMPFMDGLELAGKALQSLRDVKTVILTGYEDFDYAQQAIKLKVNDFLLKPINSQEFTGFLLKLKSELDRERQKREDLSQLRHQLNQSLPLLKERFLERMVVSRLKPEEIERKFLYFQLFLSGPAYLALTMDIDDHDKRSESDYDAELLQFAAFNIVQEIFERENGGIAFRTRDTKTVVFMSGSPRETEMLAQSLASHAKYSINKYLRLSVSIGIGRTCRDKQLLFKSYQEALSALDYRFLLGKNRIISIDDLEYGKTVEHFSYDEWEKKLLSAMRAGNRNQVKSVLEEWMEDLRKTNPSIEKCYGSVYKLVVALMNHITESGFDEKEVLGGYPFIQITAMKTLDDVTVWLYATCERILAFLNEKRNDVAKSQMILAEKFIQDNYNQDHLSLRHVCSHIFMSISYFSLLFKEHTGETFVEYLTRIRMEKAKELLVNTQLKTYEIASRVGFGDPQYFSVIFKRSTGMSPKEYRSAWKGKQAHEDPQFL